MRSFSQRTFLSKVKIGTKLVFIFLFGSLENVGVVFVAFPKYYTPLHTYVKM